MVRIQEMTDSDTGRGNDRPIKMFWGVTLDAGKKYSQIVKQSFHLSMAALEDNSGLKGSNVQVMLQQEAQEYLLCTLQHGKLLQQPLDLLFVAGEELAFSLNGTGVVHLTGYLNPEVDDSYFEEDETDDPDFTMDSTLDDGPVSSEEEEDSDDDEAPELVSPGAVVAGAKRKAREMMSGSKRQKMLNYSTGDDDEDDDDDDEDEDDDELEEFSDDFEDSDFMDDDEEEEEEESPAKKNKSKSETPVKGKKEGKSPEKKQKTPKQGGKTPQKDTPKGKGKTPSKTEETTSAAETPGTPNGESAKKKKKKKKKKKNKEGEGDADNSIVSDGGDTPKGQKQQQTPKKRSVAGGTIVEDVKIGHGPEAKPGKMVSVYFVGTLAQNNKRFDSLEKGKPLRFKLNQGEVIKGWDNGLQGMRVGGKRKLWIPASQAYGNKKQGPIPANSALQFEVELKAVS